tara:strand:- start:195 stop:587 length:393 start_codon:yes stop_codon:yes gene_type:complete
MKVYAVQEIVVTDNDISGGTIIGVYTSRWLATLAIKEVSRNKKIIKGNPAIFKEKDKSIIYDVIPMSLDTIPMNEDEYEEAIESLIKSGFVEALVGEDGLFYYVPTELGKKEGKRIIKKLKRDEEEKGGD